MAELPLDDNKKPALGLWDPTGHQVVPAQAVSVATDSSGQTYGTINVNASFSASSMAINDPNTPAQKAGVNAGGSLQVAGQGTAGTPAGGVVSIQGVAGGATIPISGSITATAQPSVVSTLNSSTATLTSNSVFTGTSESSLPFSAISVEVFANVVSAVSGLSVQQSQDGANWDTVDTFSIVANTPFNTTVNLIGQFFRVIYTNGGTNQATFRLQTIKQPVDVVLPRTLTAAGNLKVDGSAVTQPVSQLAAGSVSGTLQTAQAGNANGTPLNVLGMGVAMLTVNMTGFTGTVNFEGQEDGTNFGALNAVQVGTNTIISTAVGATTTAIARYEIPVAGLQQIQARTSGVSAGTVTVTAHAVPVPYNGKVMNTNAPTSATGTLTSVAGTVTASTQLLPSNTSRKGMMVYNDSTATLYLGFNATVTTTAYTLQISAQGFFEMPTAPVYTGVIAGVWSAATGSARITELS